MRRPVGLAQFTLIVTQGRSLWLCWACLRISGNGAKSRFGQCRDEVHERVQAAATAVVISIDVVVGSSLGFRK
jgi:hypothetical protein